MRKLLIVSLVCFLSSVISFAISKEAAVKKLVNDYPQAQLIDIYKSFFQDNFGPGHLLEDSVAAYKYFLYELQDTIKWGGPDYELTGEGKNFVRLNMDLIRKGIIPQDEFFTAFRNSMGKIESLSDSSWISEWNMIDSIIILNDYHFINEVEDREYIKDKLDSGNFPIHHSDSFNDNYQFHYRIIALPEFLNLKEKYLNCNSNQIK